jgi:hypothetical protein
MTIKKVDGEERKPLSAAHLSFIERTRQGRRTIRPCAVLEPSLTGTYVRTRYLKFHLGRVPQLQLHAYLLTSGFQ